MDLVFDVVKKVTTAAKEVFDDTAARSKTALLKSALASGRLNSEDIKTSIQLGIAYFYRTADYEILKSVVLRSEFLSTEKRCFKGGDGYIPGNIPNFDLEACGLNGFRRIMLEYGLTPNIIADSLMSGELREYVNPAKSGSLFFLTSDDEFIIKTLRDYEARFFQSDLLNDYYHNLAKRKTSFLARYFGLFGYTQQSTLFTLRFTVMSNIVPSAIPISERYDLKGSRKGRQASVSERLKSEPTFKDLDFLDLHPGGITLPPGVYDRLKEVITDDVEILKGWNVMDYSLLLGICNLDNTSIAPLSPVVQNLSTVGTFSPMPSYFNRSSSFGPFSIDGRQKYNSPLKRLFPDIQQMSTFDHSIAKKYGGIPAKNEKGERLILFLGIIDILQTYDTGKQVQNYIQGINADDEHDRSIVEPNFYADRFLYFIFNRVFKRGFNDLGTVNLTHLFAGNAFRPRNVQNTPVPSSMVSRKPIDRCPITNIFKSLQSGRGSKPPSPCPSKPPPLTTRSSSTSHLPSLQYRSEASVSPLPYPVHDEFPMPQPIFSTTVIRQQDQYAFLPTNEHNEQNGRFIKCRSNSSFCG